MPRAELSEVPHGAFDPPGGFLESIEPQDLVYFCLNEGDGDSQLLLLPQAEPGPRQAIVVDVCSPKKLLALVGALLGADPRQPLRPLLNDPPSLPLVVATHPHDDHIAGMGDFLATYGAGVRSFWDPGYRHSTQAYRRMMSELAGLPQVDMLQPTAGTTTWIGQLRITALSPGIALRNHFDSYGVDINDSSISLRLEFPASAVVKRGDDYEYQPPPSRAALVLGADSQALSWAQMLVDFPRLEPSVSPISQALRKATGADFLGASVFKVSHHASNRGSYLELIQKIQPRYCLVTADPTASRHGFPHMVAIEGIREALQQTATTHKSRDDDHAIGLHVTGANDAGGAALGSIAIVMQPGERGSLALWRFGDSINDAVVLAQGRRLK